MKVRARIEFEGIVQGVGFRPFLHKLALDRGLAGWALNTSAGVLMELEGERQAIADYVEAVRQDGPPLSRVLVTRVRHLPLAGFSDFTIQPSRRAEGELTLLCPDVATCADCRRELADPRDRRYRYPFTNCTNCGPRYTIVTSLPYDRPRTTMTGFPLCERCRAEYEDVEDRRYHAQPVACDTCGPRLTFETAAGEQLDVDVIAESARRLVAGETLALKGLGGFHLACRADSDEAVLALRRRKQRSFFKPLAVMVADLSAARELCEVDAVAADWLKSPVSPVVLLPLRAGVSGRAISAYVAPRLDRLGLMLPYTPLHHLLLSEVQLPLVMTSGNLSDEPIVSDNDKARARLSPLVDGLVLHDRPIHARCDDSVISVEGDGGYTTFRHSRGFSPYPLALPEEGPAVLALGGDIKTTFAASRGQFVFLSPHLGDGEHLATYAFFRETWEHYRSLFGLQPEAIACDLHPGYHTARWARELATELGVPLIRVQHHHAHLVALQTELGITGPSTAIVADGTGYGLDGTLWGGEVLRGDAGGCERVAHLRPLLLPGGDAATAEPWRIALSLLHEAAPDRLDDYVARLLSGEPPPPQSSMAGWLPDSADPRHRPPDPREVELVTRMLRSGTALVQSTALGRLFDGLAALLKVTLRTTYEGQAPMELEALARASDSSPTVDLPPDGDGAVIDWVPLVRAITESGQGIDHWPAAFHHWAAWAFIRRAAPAPAGHRDAADLLASGGCLQNSLLRRLLSDLCTARGLQLRTHRDLPPGDGGLALGVLRVAQAGLARGRTAAN